MGITYVKHCGWRHECMMGNWELQESQEQLILITVSVASFFTKHVITYLKVNWTYNIKRVTTTCITVLWNTGN
jgi:hypothetical protein